MSLPLAYQNSNNWHMLSDPNTMYMYVEILEMLVSTTKSMVQSECGHTTHVYTWWLQFNWFTI